MVLRTSVVGGLSILEQPRQRSREVLRKQAGPHEVLVEPADQLRMAGKCAVARQMEGTDGVKRSIVGAGRGIVPGRQVQENLRRLQLCGGFLQNAPQLLLQSLMPSRSMFLASGKARLRSHSSRVRSKDATSAS